MILNIIDKIYENNYFTTILIAAAIILVLLFIIVFILGKKEEKKRLSPPVKDEEDVKDITFDNPPEINNIKEDVTFEMPILTKNLENFKKNLEEEIQKEDIVEVRKTSGIILPEPAKPVKILDIKEIEDTSIIPTTIEEKESKKTNLLVSNESEEKTKKVHLDENKNKVSEKNHKNLTSIFNRFTSQRENKKAHLEEKEKEEIEVLDLEDVQLKKEPSTIKEEKASSKYDPDDNF